MFPVKLIRRQPIASFFILAILMSWISWLPYVLSRNGLGVLDLTYRPLLGTTQFAGVLPGAYMGPVFSAFLVTWIADGRTGLRSWVCRMRHWRVNWRWYALSLLGVPAAMILIGLGFSGGQVAAPSLLIVLAYVPGLALQVLTTGLAEEPGWRDFALPRLQRRFGALGAAAILGPVWAVWHLPLFFSEWGGWPHTTWLHVAAFIVFCIGFNVVIAWLFNRTGGSLPLVVLAHASVNNFSSVVWSQVFPALDTELVMPALACGAVVAAAIVTICTRGRVGYSAPVATSDTALHPTILDTGTSVSVAGARYKAETVRARTHQEAGDVLRQGR